MLLKTVRYFERKNQLDQNNSLMFFKKDEDMLFKFRLRL